MRPAILLSLALAAAGAAAPESATLADVLARTAEYVSQFQTQLSGIVAEEHYVQEVKFPIRRPVTGGGGPFNMNRMRRLLLSDLLLVKPEGAADWMQFRDVYEVDGVAVRDRDERLFKLFLSPTESVGRRVSGIMNESARYNIGPVDRTVNAPVLPLLFLEAKHQRRFKFKRTTDTAPSDITAEPPAPRTGHFTAPAGAWVVEFAEQEKGTMVRTTNMRDIPAHGRFWIDPSSGRVLMSELLLQNGTVRGLVIVNYQSEPLVGLFVPTEMRERYDRLRDGSIIDGYATYGHFRQFQVTVDEKLGPVKKPDVDQ